MRRLILAAFTLAISHQLIGGDSDTLARSAGWTNGRIWVTMPLRQRAMYVVACYEGMNFIAEVTDSTKATELAQGIRINELTAVEIAKVVDGFYLDAANVRVPIVFALTWARRKVSGASESELNTLAAQYRTRYAGKERIIR